MTHDLHVHSIQESVKWFYKALLANKQEVHGLRMLSPNASNICHESCMIIWDN